MKKIVKIITILTLIICISQTLPALELETEESVENNETIQLKIFFAIGLIDVEFDDDTINGFVIIGYSAGEIILLKRVNIEVEGNLFVITHGLFTTLVLYRSP